MGGIEYRCLLLYGRGRPCYSYLLVLGICGGRLNFARVPLLSLQNSLARPSALFAADSLALRSSPWSCCDPLLSHSLSLSLACSCEPVR